MPSMQLDLLELKKNKYWVAKDLIPENTNLGPAFMVTANTGSFTRDIITTKLGMYLLFNKKKNNTILRHDRYKIYLITTRAIQTGEKIVCKFRPEDLPVIKKKYFS